MMNIAKLLLIPAGLLMAAPASAQLSDEALKERSIGRVLSVRGITYLRPTGKLDEGTVPVERGMYLEKGAIVRTERNSAVRLLMKDRSILDIGPSSYITLARYEVKKKKKKRSVGLHVFVGRLWARVTKVFSRKKNFDVYTPNAVAGIRGTELVVDVDLRGTSTVTCVSGLVEVGNIVSPLDDAVQQVTQMLQPMQAMAVDPAGNMQQQTVTQDQIQNMAKDVQTGGGMDPGNADSRRDAAKEQNQNSGGDGGRDPAQRPQGQGGQQGQDEGGRDGEGPDGGGDRLENVGQRDPGDSPLDLDPSTGRTRVRGRIEIRE